MHRVPRHSGVLRFVEPESQKRRRLRRMGPAPRKAFPETRGTFEDAVPRRAATDNIQALSDLRFSCLVIHLWRLVCVSEPITLPFRQLYGSKLVVKSLETSGEPARSIKLVWRLMRQGLRCS